MSLTIIVRKSFSNFTGKHLCRILLSKVTGPQNWNFIKKRTQTRAFFCEICTSFKKVSSYRTSPLAPSGRFRFPAWHFNKRDTAAKMFFCELWKIFKNISRQNNCRWLFLVFISEFWGVFQSTYYRIFRRNYLFHVQVKKLEPPDTLENYFSRSFQTFYRRTRNCHSKLFIYLKSLKTTNEVWRCQALNLRNKRIRVTSFEKALKVC